MQLQNDLLKITLAESGYETRRDYISLSHIISGVDELVKAFHNGYEDNESIRLKCRMGYWMERGMMERLIKIKGVEPGAPIIVPESNGLVKGHPDFFYEGCPGDCKSFPADEHIPSPSKIPKRIYWQMNAYMLYSNAKRSLIVCESRQTGKMVVINIFPNAHVQQEIKNKVREILVRLQSRSTDA